ncbi:MAG: NosD domain-containing protein [Thermoplasmatota archaeon]
MNQQKTALFISCIILSSFITGCVETNIDGTNDDINDLNTLYVSYQGTKQYHSIQEAIDAAPENHTIFVYAGIYYEHIFINKSVILRGETKENTIIDGNHTDDVIFIDEGGHVNISGFTIQNSGSDEITDHDSGIDIKSNDNVITGNNICNNTIGIYSTYAQNNTFKQNDFDSNKGYGMYLYTASDNSIVLNNVFTNNSYAIRIKGSKNNNVTQNLFLENYRGLYFCCGSRTNLVYHNTFMNNTLWDAKDDVTGNNWDNGYPSGGNYWDDYLGIDEFQGADQTIAGSDGIGDTAYNLSTTGNKIDHYPLMKPVVSL